MSSSKYYFFADFISHGRSEFRREYNTVAADELYTLEYKTYYDENGRLQRHRMVLVGHFHFRDEGPPVWAHSNGRIICYYYGRENLLQVVRGDLESRVYYDEPFSFVAGSQGADGMTPARQLGMTLVEAIVHFLFLKNNIIQVLLNPERKDVLRYFKVACLNFEPNRRAEEEIQRIKSEQEDFDDILASCYMTPPPSGSRTRTYPSTPSKVKYETLSDDEELHKPPSASRPRNYPSTPTKRRYDTLFHDNKLYQTPSSGHSRGPEATSSMIKYESMLDDDDELYKSPTPVRRSDTTSSSQRKQAPAYTSSSQSTIPVIDLVSDSESDCVQSNNYAHLKAKYSTLENEVQSLRRRLDFRDSTAGTSKTRRHTERRKERRRDHRRHKKSGDIVKREDRESQDRASRMGCLRYRY